MTTNQFLSPAEAEALKLIEAAEASGGDAYGDLDDDTTTAAVSADAAAATEAAAADKAETDELAADAGAQAAETTAQATTNEGAQGDTMVDEQTLAEIADPLGLDEQPAITFRAEVPADLAEKRAELFTEKGQALEKLMSGEIDAAEYAAIETRLAGELDTLSRQQARAETLAEINQQSAAQKKGAVINSLIEATKPVLDYTSDPVAARQFDAALAMLALDPQWAAKPYAAQAAQANKQVLSLRGLSLPDGEKTPSADTTHQKPAGGPRKITEALPTTLRGVPNAATPNAGGGVAEQMATLKGEAFEEAFAKLPPAQQAALLDD